MEILRILQKSSQSADSTKLKLCQEPFANSAGKRTQIKALRLYALSSLVRSLGKPYTRYHWKQWNLYKLQREEGRDLTQSCYKRLYTNVLKIYQKPSSNLKIRAFVMNLPVVSFFLYIKIKRKSLLGTWSSNYTSFHNIMTLLFLSREHVQISC